MFVRINYSNGYCGCDVSEVIEVENMKEAEEYAGENLRNYAEPYAYAAIGWDQDCESEEEEEDYFENCTFDIEEITEKEYQEEI